MSENNSILVSVSGGRTSAFMAIYLKNLWPEKNIEFVFANTGKEKEETLIFLDKLDKHWELGIVWLEADVNPIKGKGTKFKKVNFETASRNGEPFYDVIKKYGLPSKLFRHCTRELKERPIHKYAKSIFGSNYITAIGIRADEKHRIGKNPKNIYPLNDINVTKDFINKWWFDQPFNLELDEHEGNCDFCFLKSPKKRLKLLSEGLNVDWWNKMEQKFSTPIQPIFDVRNKKSIEDLIKINNENIKTELSNVDFDCYCKAS